MDQNSLVGKASRKSMDGEERRNLMYKGDRLRPPLSYQSRTITASSDPILDSSKHSHLHQPTIATCWLLVASYTMSSADVLPINEAVQLLQTFAPSGTPVEFVESTAVEIQGTAEGKAWLEASRALREKYKHALVIEPAGEHTNITALAFGGGAFNASSGAVGSMVSLLAKFRVQITSDSLKKQFNCDNWGFFLTIPGFLA